MATLEMQMQMTLMLIKVVADQKNITIKHRIDGADVAELMLSLIHKETTRLRAIQANPNREDNSDGDEHHNSSSSVLVPKPVHASPSTPPTSQPSGAMPSPSAAATPTQQPSPPSHPHHLHVP